MEDQTLHEQLKPQQPSVLKHLGRAVRSAFRIKNAEGRELKTDQDTERSFLAVLPGGSLLEVNTKVLSETSDFTIAKESEQPSDEYNIVSIPDGRATTHILMSKELNTEGRYAPVFRATRTWFDPDINDYEVKEALPLYGVTDAFEVDEVGSTFVIRLRRGMTVSTVTSLEALPDGFEGTPEDSRDHELKLVLNSFAESHIAEKSPDVATL